MKKSSEMILTLNDIVRGSYPIHEAPLGDFKVSLVDIVRDNIRGCDNIPDHVDLKIDEWHMDNESGGIRVVYSWEDRPKINIEDMETVVLEIMEKIYDHRRDFTSVSHLESEIRDVFMDNFEPIED